MLCQLLAALAYRTQKGLRHAPEEFADFEPGEKVRSPRELLRHMTSVLGYARTFIIGGEYWPENLSAEQPPPVRRDRVWREAPEGWEPDE